MTGVILDTEWKEIVYLLQRVRYKGSKETIEKFTSGFVTVFHEPSKKTPPKTATQTLAFMRGIFV
jgi:hypothetical protein